MELLGLILRVMLLVGLFIALRRIERWLHQHIFKVGWLATHNYQTTTILYYTFFLPGVVLHEVIYWLTAGILNVRAEHSIQWPDAQEVGELKLNFVQISSRAAAWRKAIISISPLLAGIIATWFIAENILQITAAVAVMGSGELSAVAEGISVLTAAPNFWLWVYIIFTIANTMFPQIPKDLQGWRAMLLAAAAIFLALTLIGLGGEIFEALSPTIDTLIDTLLTTIIFLMLVDFLTVLVLGTIEYTIERITGHSATFKGGKMYTMTREEAQEERRKERERERRRAERQRRAEEALPANVYTLAFPIPGSPSEIPVTKLTVEEPRQEPRFAGSAVPDDEQAAEPAPSTPDDLAARIRMPEPRSLSASATDEEQAAPEEPTVPRRPDIAASLRRPAVPPISVETDPEPADQPLAQTSFSRRPSIRLTDREADEQQKQPEANETARPVVETRPPISLTPANEKDESEASSESATPVTPLASHFGVRPPQPTVTPDDEDDKEKELAKPVAPAASRFGVRPPQPSIVQDDEPEVEEDENAAEEKSPWKRPDVKPSQPFAASSSSDDDAQGDAPLQDMKPATPKGSVRPTLSRFSARPFQPSKPQDEDTSEDEAESKPESSRPTGFSSLVTPQPAKPRQKSFNLAEEADDEDEKPAAPRRSLRFGMQPFNSASPSNADDETETTDEPASSLSSFRSALGSSSPALSDDEDMYYEDEDEYFDDDDDEYAAYDDDE